MRISPWHLRLPTTEHYQWFKNLVNLHALTLHWIQDAQIERFSYSLIRGFSQEVTDHLWMLQSLQDKELDDFLNDVHPADILARLENTIWTIQGWTLSHLISKTPTANRTTLDNLLSQTTFKLGNEVSEKQWGRLLPLYPPLGQALELGDILLAMNDSPFSAYPRGGGFLIKRSIQNEVQIELRFCPHHQHYPEVKPVADRLCRLHAQWMHGFISALNHQTKIEHIIQQPRCVQRWFSV